MEVAEIRDNWRELWFKMADGQKSEYEKIKATNVFEFFKILTLWKQKIKLHNERLKKNIK